jgi:hypothetical protein
VINKTSAFSLIVSAVLLACSSNPTEKKGEDGNLIENAGGGGGDSASGGGASGGGSPNPSSTVEQAARTYCERSCACYGCEEGPEECIEHFSKSKEKGTACDELWADVLGCAMSTMDGCPAEYDWQAQLEGCAPPMSEQEAVCGPGGIAG